ncbi:MAG: helix-turn-helix domain-containing protein [Spirochaetes bacterium]|nr:helix-turn-helix domain-containing protein [Spirochaetota bacterium]
MRHEHFRLHQEIVRCISARRRSEHLSQEQLALRAGLHRNTVRLLETGQIDPTFTSISRVMAALGTIRMGLAGRKPEIDCAPSAEDFMRGLTTHYGAYSWDWMIAVAGEAIRRRRVELGASQADLADAAVVSVNTIGRIERGEVDPNSSTILAIYRALEVHEISVQDARVYFA